MRKLPSEAGQAILLVLLSMAVVLTIVLSIISRSITDIKISTKEEEALRAFSAAEAGVERALAGLIVGITGTIPIGENAFFRASVTGTGQVVPEFSYPSPLSAGESLIIWFVDHVDLDGDGNLDLGCTGNRCFTGSKVKVCWGKPGAPPSTTPAIEVSVFYSNPPVSTGPNPSYQNVKIARDTADPNLSRRSANAFGGDDGVSSCQIEGETFAFQKTLDFASLGIPPSSYNAQNGLQFAKIRMFYNTDIAQPVGVSVSGFAGNTSLPPQGLKIVSTGTSGEATRKVEVFQGYGESPPIFDAAIFSPPGLTK